MSFELRYKDLIFDVLHNGNTRDTRAGSCISTFGRHLTIKSLRKGLFPIITGRKMYPAGIIGEMAAFLHGPTKLSDFTSRGCNYWAKWAEPDGSLDLDYGNAWRNWGGIDQIQQVVNTIKHDPNDRRMIITGWDPIMLPTLSLPCCHMLYQFYVNDGYLDIMWYQRSADVMVGVPSDIVLAALFVILMANATNLKPGTINMTFGDTHIYSSHRDGALEYLNRTIHELPYWLCDGDINDFEPHNFKLEKYVSEKPIKFTLEG